MIYKVETIKDGTEKYFFIRNLETMSIEELPSKYLMHGKKLSQCGMVMSSQKRNKRLNHKFCGISDSSRSSVGSYRIASERNIRHQDIRIPVCEES